MASRVMSSGLNSAIGRPLVRYVSTNGKHRVVVLGTGWSSFSFTKHVDTSLFDVTVISPRNHFLFTPLLASTAVGTLEFRSIVEPIRDITGKKDMTYHWASADKIDPENKHVYCSGEHPLRDVPFQLPYDTLVIGLGVIPGTFGVPGVLENAVFLKELPNARKIRQRIIACFETARDPSVSDDTRRRLLSFVVVGGGPTGVEFCAELGDFMHADVPRYYPHLDRSMIKITLLEAGTKLLTAFDRRIVSSAMANFEKMGIEVRVGARVEEVGQTEISLAGGEKIPFGLCVWSAGISPRPVVETLDLPKDKSQRLITDHFLQCKGHKDIFVIGDCGTIEGLPLPATAQVARQQGLYLANALGKQLQGKPVDTWEYHHLGLMAYTGRYKALFDSRFFKDSGFVSWLAWRSAYFARLGSIKNMMQVPLDWTKTFLWGRDITMF
mmetsp:Transcript_9671/g.22190  ORF Transcript_9671/g.22190 Transcript_9671/m.22190 type:complete len:439 (+) Transcript_9671:1-1317(+)